MKYWPGTNIPRSTKNAFDLSACKGALAAMLRESTQKAEAGLKGAQAQQARRGK